MNDKLKNIKILPPCFLGKGNYEIEIKDSFMIDLPNEGKLGKNSKWCIIPEGKNFTFVDLVTLKKVMDKTGNYPKLKKNEVMTITSLALCKLSKNVCVSGDVIKVKSVPKG